MGNVASIPGVNLAQCPPWGVQIGVQAETTLREASAGTGARKPRRRVPNRPGNLSDSDSNEEFAIHQPKGPERDFYLLCKKALLDGIELREFHPPIGPMVKDVKMILDTELSKLKVSVLGGNDQFEVDFMKCKQVNIVQTHLPKIDQIVEIVSRDDTKVGLKFKELAERKVAGQCLAMLVDANRGWLPVAENLSAAAVPPGVDRDSTALSL
eukprot:TRINITY_DN26767_c0_g1_i1.p1 TRINITY_DN26767_c0_g1~~TRINITY_DN26767_c0_g1_i1.p1  ORF type:complete len:231 (+),score=53.57 TRINITY_DN26767_c0_g1_i1:62-694(+)